MGGNQGGNGGNQGGNQGNNEDDDDNLFNWLKWLVYNNILYIYLLDIYNFVYNYTIYFIIWL